MSDLEAKVLKTIKEFGLIEKGDIIAVGVSGGADSMVLLSVLGKLSEELECQVKALHFEHGIRGAESEEDLFFVESFCKERGISIMTEHGNVPDHMNEGKTNLEEVARDRRYAFFERCIKKGLADKIAVAHHMNDSAETTLFNMIRGAGVSGLGGMKYLSGPYIRPLLDVSRKEIEEYAKEQGIPYRHDSTNDDLSLARNRIRAHIIRELESINEGAVNNIFRTSKILEEEDAYLDGIAEDAFNSIQVSGAGNDVRIEIGKLRTYEPVIRKRIIRKGIMTAIGKLKDITQNDVERMLKLAMEEKTGKRYSTSRMDVAISYGLLIIRNKKATIKDTSFYPVDKGNNPLPNGAFLRIEEEEKPLAFPEKTSLIQYIDGDALPEGCVLRTRREGDVFAPFGVKGHKKLKDWFIDSKVDREDRDRILLLAKDDVILWIIGKSLSDLLRIRIDTKNVLKLTYEEGL